MDVKGEQFPYFHSLYNPSRISKRSLDVEMYGFELWLVNLSSFSI